jgi:tetratricopeptide (TPR) repeat protein
MPPNPLHQDRLRQAHALQMQGQLGAASDIYRAVLAEDPNNAPALHLLGLLVMQAGQVEPGLAFVRQSLVILPDFAPAHESLGKGLERLGRREEALAAYDRLVKLTPGHPEGYVHRARVLGDLFRHSDALKNLDTALSLKNDPRLMLNRGAMLLQLQRPREALTAFDKAIAAGVAQALAWFNRGVALTALSRPDEALAAYDEALLLQPDYTDAFINRGLVLESLQRPNEALLSYERALSLNPEAMEAKANRTSLLARMGHREEAMAEFDELIALEPDNPVHYSNRGAVLKTVGQPELAIRDFDKALSLVPDDAALLSNRAITLQSVGRFDEALADYERAISLGAPADVLQFNYGVLLLLLGRFAEGLPHYEKRRFGAAPPDLDPAQRWQGLSQSVAGKTVLVYGEQGLGDIIQLSRYLIDLSAMGAKIVFAIRDSMVRLLRTLPVSMTFIPENTRPAAFDYHVAMGSLPLAFGIELQTIAAPVPYLKAEPERSAKWRTRIGSHGLRIAISWQGKIHGINDPFRAFPLAVLAPLAAIPGVRLISLQKGEGVEQLDALPEGMVVEKLGDDFDAGIDAFIDTTAVMEACDLVISCDTSIAHLAGALGRPVWVALKSVPEWRWQMDRTDTPWYPTMTLYRQPSANDWKSVVAEMTRDLKAKLD